MLGGMKAHELAELLLTMPNLDVILRVHGHDYSTVHDRNSHGPLEIGLSSVSYFDKVERLIIGDMIDSGHYPVKMLVGTPRERR